MEKLIKTTQNIKISGTQKAAILLAELNSKNFSNIEIYKALKLKPEEVKKLRIATQYLGKYDQNNSFQTKREIQVLEEALEYGKEKGIYTVVDVKAQTAQKNKEIFDEIKKDPSTTGKILSKWLQD